MTRHLIALILLIASAAAVADVGFQVRHRPNDYYVTGQAACDSTIAEAAALSTNVNITRVVWDAGGGTCLFDVVRISDGRVFKSQGLRCLANGLPCIVDTYACTTNDPATLTWPIGRQFTDSTPYQDFGFGIPAQSCISGCRASLDPAGTTDTYALADQQNSNAEIVWSDLAYKLTGPTCPSSEATKAPDVPPVPANPCQTNPQAPGCPGSGTGGDTGGGTGGNTGGGDTGGGTGGNTGGGDTGGGTGGNTGGGTGGNTGGGTGGNTGGGTGGNTGGGTGSNDNGSASGTDCGTSLSCTGDAVGCAIARIQKDFSCRTKEGSDFPAQKDALKQLIGDPQFAPEADKEINVADLFNKGARFLPAACPPPKSLSLITNGGRAFEISYDPLCQLATDLGYLIIVAASIFYAIYVGRAAGGE